RAGWLHHQRGKRDGRPPRRRDCVEDGKTLVVLRSSSLSSLSLRVRQFIAPFQIRGDIVFDVWEKAVAPRTSNNGGHWIMRWRLRDHIVEVGPRPLVMGIVNVTPDSFSDGWRFAAIDAAVAHGLKLAAEGADLLDIG